MKTKPKKVGLTERRTEHLEGKHFPEIETSLGR